MKESISVDEARAIILDSVVRMGGEKLPITEGLGRILAESIASPWDLPPLDNSAMDGFAIRAVDVGRATLAQPASLEVIDELPAGRLPTTSLRPGTAIRIMTGAATPEGADAVVRVEDTRSEGATVLIKSAVQPGENVRRAGEDVRRGEEVLAAGAALTPAAIAMAASVGRSFVRVVQRPRVAILSTGDELVEVDGSRKHGRIVASNLYALEALVRECGAFPLSLGVAADREEAIEASLREALIADAIITTGGVSVGDYDWVKGVLARLGTEMKFWRVAMKPGHPLAFGALGGKPVFGLPGNPVSCMISFEQFVRPALLRMMGHRHLRRPSVPALLQETLHQRPGRTSFLRALVSRDGEAFRVRLAGNQSSGALLPMVRANGLLVFPAHLSELREGDLTQVEIIDPSFWELA